MQYHVPVMSDEVLRYLLISNTGTYVDGTLGGGGHAEKILNLLDVGATFLGIDADEDALTETEKKLKRFTANIHLIRDNTVHLSSILQAHNITAIHGLLLDLGVSSFQLDEGSKGFSFRTKDRLDMRMDRRQTLDAYTVINSYNENELANIFWQYGEERLSRKIAKIIVHKRTISPIETTGDLAETVERVIHGRFAIKVLARVFQAIRIEVNNELHNLQTILNDSLQYLVRGARIVVISYHSLEDRIVKKFFSDSASTFISSGNKFQSDTPRVPQLKIITKKPLIASEEEIQRNSRSRSAKMRVAEKL